jgi:hypothetical protein
LTDRGAHGAKKPPPGRNQRRLLRITPATADQPDIVALAKHNRPWPGQKRSQRVRRRPDRLEQQKLSGTP